MRIDPRRSFRFILVHLFGCLVPLLLLGGCEEDIRPARAIQLMRDPTSADARRTGIAALSTRWNFGKLPPYPGYYQKIARDDSDYTVRAMAIRALNICRDGSATPIFVAGLRDKNELVRLESAKALANLPAPDAVLPLFIAVSGSREELGPDGHAVEVAENQDVRIAAADALRRYRDLKNGRAKGMPEPTGGVESEVARDASAVARFLISHLNDLDFGVAWQCRQSLITMTGQDFRYDEAAWLAYLAGPSKPFG